VASVGARLIRTTHTALAAQAYRRDGRCPSPPPTALLRRQEPRAHERAFPVPALAFAGALIPSRAGKGIRSPPQPPAASSPCPTAHRPCHRHRQHGSFSNDGLIGFLTHRLRFFSTWRVTFRTFARILRGFDRFSRSTGIQPPQLDTGYRPGADPGRTHHGRSVMLITEGQSEKDPPRPTRGGSGKLRRS